MLNKSQFDASMISVQVAEELAYMGVSVSFVPEDCSAVIDWDDTESLPREFCVVW